MEHGPQGHTVSAMLPVEVVILEPAADGSQAVAIGETERIYGTHWTVVVTLRPGRSFLEERIRIYNPTEMVRPYYFWNCTAMPNTPGFRFIYPMTLGCDHSAKEFFTWPLDHGKDLSRGTNYQDASSIFAWFCDQDFFGSYDDAADRGVVSHANHREVRGKKAWTWGQGGFGRMHQRDLTDSDGPYNEVQTGPLLTQGEVGRLEPSEAVSWQEWWYPIHGLGGFTFANRDLAANAAFEGRSLHLRLLGTGTWSPVDVRVLQGTNLVAQSRCQISPQRQTDLMLALPATPTAVEVEVQAGDHVLARFRTPLELPVRHPPEKKAEAQTASEFAQAGWDHFLFGRFAEARQQFRKALDKDVKCVAALAGLAYVDLDTDPTASARSARAALESNPDHGLSQFVLAVAEARLEHSAEALDHAWQAALDPATAVAGRSLIAKLGLRAGEWDRVVEALSAPGPWQNDVLCRNQLALARLQLGQPQAALALVALNLEEEPLDVLARYLQATALSNPGRRGLNSDWAPRPQTLMELVEDLVANGQFEVARHLALSQVTENNGNSARSTLDALWYYWAAFLSTKSGLTDRQSLASLQAQQKAWLARAMQLPPDGVHPARLEDELPLRWALETNPKDGKAALYLGHLLFYQGRHEAARELWRQSVRLGAAPVVACRALGLASLTLDDNAEAATNYLTQAHALARTDPIVARDLARVLLSLAEKASDKPAQDQLSTQARNTLKEAYEAGQGRSDFVALLGKVQNQLGEYAATAKMLDSVRVTVWEGAHEVHDLFEDAHLAMGEALLKSGQFAPALAEFDRALEYPENLAVGRLENAPEARIHYARGNALAGLGRKDAAKEAWHQAAEAKPNKDARHEEARQKAKEALER